MDSSGFIEKCRICGGTVIKVTKSCKVANKSRKRGFFVSLPNKPKKKIKQYMKCKQFLKKADIVSVMPNEILGWKTA